MSDREAVGTERAKLLVIVPTYNERGNLPKLLARMAAQPMPADILVVDDNSQDGTGEFADQFARENPNVHVLHRST